MPEGQAPIAPDGRKPGLFHDLSADALVYGCGVVLQSALLFGAAPLYARLLPRAEYGALTLLLSVMSGGETLARFGVHYAFLTLVQHRAEPDLRRRLTRAAASALLLQAAVLGAALAISGVFLRGRAPLGDSRLAFSLIGLHLLLSAPAVLLQAAWRAEGRAARVLFLSVAQIGGACGLALVFVGTTSLGATGVILGYAAASAFCGGVAVARLRPLLAPRTHASDLRELYRLGVGYTLIQLATLGLLHARRWTLSFVDSLSAAAAYDVAYRVGQVVSLAVVTPFSVAWTTGVFQVARDEAAGRVAGRVFTYLMAALAWLGLALCVFAREDVLLVGGRAYLDAEPLVPVLVFASVLWGAISSLSGAPVLARRSREGLLAATAGLATCLALNAALTPRLAALGAALAVLGGSLVACAALAHGARQWLAVHYEWPRLARLAAASAVILCLVPILPSPRWVSLALRAGSVLAFPLLLRTLGFFDSGEWQAALRLPAAALARARARAPSRSDALQLGRVPGLLPARHARVLRASQAARSDPVRRQLLLLHGFHPGLPADPVLPDRGRRALRRRERRRQGGPRRAPPQQRRRVGPSVDGKRLHARGAVELRMDERLPHLCGRRDRRRPGRPRGPVIGPTPGATGDVYVAVSTGSLFAFSGRWSYGWSAGYELNFADVDGDGKADLVGRYIGTTPGITGDVYVMRSTGTGFSWYGLASRWSYGWGADYDVIVRDFTGDFRADLAGRLRLTGEVHVAPSTGGTRFLYHGVWATGIGTDAVIR